MQPCCFYCWRLVVENVKRVWTEEAGWVGGGQGGGQAKAIRGSRGRPDWTCCPPPLHPLPWGWEEFEARKEGGGEGGLQNTYVPIDYPRWGGGRHWGGVGRHSIMIFLCNSSCHSGFEQSWHAWCPSLVYIKTNPHSCVNNNNDNNMQAKTRNLPAFFEPPCLNPERETNSRNLLSDKLVKFSNSQSQQVVFLSCPGVVTSQRVLVPLQDKWATCFLAPPS